MCVVFPNEKVKVKASLLVYSQKSLSKVFLMFQP